MKHGSLFSGIGGFDLAAEWMGWSNIFHCEWMPFQRKVLSHYWPEAISYHDITTTDFRQHHGQIDILTGGFPCQPYSAAGKRLGKEDDRHLWPEMLRAIREIRPRWVVGENVRGLTNWNRGMVFDEVQSDLEIAGYEVLPFILPACAVDAPHRRDRVWFVAYCDNGNWAENRLQARGQINFYGIERTGTTTNSEYWRTDEKIRRGNEQRAQHGTARYGDKESSTDANNAGTDKRMRSKRTRQTSDGDERFSRFEYRANGCDGDAADATYCGCGRGNCEKRADGWERVLQDECGRGKVGCQIEGCCGEWDADDSSSAELQGCIQHRGLGGKGQIKADGRQFGGSVCTTWQDFPTQSPICGGDDGLPTQLDGITFPKWRAESIKGYGNAIVPQVALQIFRAIEQYEHNTNFGEHQ